MPNVCMEPLQVIEFYAGIGGWHYAVKKTGLDLTVLKAIDINTTANCVYRHNFSSTKLLQRNISGLTAKELDLLSADIFTLSPPCQPFTRQGKKEDSADHRTDSFFHLMQVLGEMKNVPRYLMMENVQGFEVSQTRDHFLAVLKKIGYKVQEFLLSPKQFGIPNSRLRYYLLARLQPLSFSVDLPTQPYQSIDIITQYLPSNLFDFTGVQSTSGNTSFSILYTDTGSEYKIISRASAIEQPESDDILMPKIETCTDDDIPKPKQTPLKLAHIIKPVIKPISKFLEPLSEVELVQYLVPDKVLQKYAMALDIVQSQSTCSCCFTRGYYHYTVGTGSVLQHNTQANLDRLYRIYQEKKMADNSEGNLEPLRELQLRYFTPKEVANLMCFPSDHTFPPDITLGQCYRLLGNSVNVLVVATLLRYLLLTK